MSEADELRKELGETKAELRRLEELQNVFRLWVGLKQKLFPSECGGTDVRGVDLVSLDVDVAGCVSNFLTKGVLTQSQLDALYNCEDSLNLVNPELQGYAGWYFRRLQSLTSAVIAYLQRWG